MCISLVLSTCSDRLSHPIMKPYLRKFRRPFSYPEEGIICFENKYHVRYDTYSTADQYYFMMPDNCRTVLGLQIWYMLGHVALTSLGNMVIWQGMQEDFDPDVDRYPNGSVETPIDPYEMYENPSVFFQDETVSYVLGRHGLEYTPLHIAKLLIQYIEV